MFRPRVLIADDHQVILQALQTLLERECEVVALARDGHEAIEAARTVQPEVAVLDISMPRLNGLDAIQRLREVSPDSRVIFLTVDEEPATAAEALRLGARGYVVKSAAATELFDAIRAVRRGETWVTPRIPADRLEQEAIQDGPSGRRKILTPRQREVVQLLAEGHSMKQAASVLKITPRTIAFHKYKVMEEQNLKTNADLIQLAIREGLIARA
jgi:DNA-binding NarL/FixJ family response regulator